MKKSWPSLKNAPILLAAAELRFKLSEKLNTDWLKKDDSNLTINYPIRLDNFAGNISLPGPQSGISTATIDSKRVGFTYTNVNKTRKIIISKENLAYVQEEKYTNWKSFKDEWLKIVTQFSPVLEGVRIERVSIRFINQFIVHELSTPLEYFNTVISAKDGVIKYPVDLYFYRYVTHIPETPIRVNIVNSLQEITKLDYTFIFDIDVLNDENFVFDLKKVSEILEILREIKNETFFNNITDKTLDIIS